MEASKPGPDILYASKLHHENAQVDEKEDHIKWSDLIFLPFHPVFQLLVLICVIVKSTLGPLQSLYSVSNAIFMKQNFVMNFMFNCHWYVVDALYGVDTVLHILHRQVTDEARRREYMPKSAILLCLDIISLIPFFRLLAKEGTPHIQLWPNLLAFNEFLVVYRIYEYFQLLSIHSYCKLILGLCLLMTISVNCVSCLWMLLTYYGLCKNCNELVLNYDWRACVALKMNTTAMDISTYVYANVFISSHALRRVVDHILPSTILEFLASCLFMLAGYTVFNVLVLSRAFSESIFRLKRVCSKFPSVKKIIEETKRRHPSGKAYKHVETYYTTMWRRRSGIVHMPDIIEDLPRNLRLSIKQDLFWPLFYHSPILRRRSWAFKRFLSENVHISYKLPGERFYAGSQCLCNLYYVKSGVVQLISSDDGISPILSVTSGTIFGDINFLIPHRRRKVILRCLTYCEVLSLTRAVLIKGLQKFPEDRKEILKLYVERIDHARNLFACKQEKKHLDRNEDEDIAWIKRRWWKIFEVVSTWKKKLINRRIEQKNARCELPPEESTYHCSKYLGQLVLCTLEQLKTKSMFVYYSFPWIMAPYSTFRTIWKKVVICTVLVALCVYPYYITHKSDLPIWDEIISWIDFIYLVDLYISLTTAVRIQENEIPNFGTILFQRCKSFEFILDVLATIKTEYIMLIINKPAICYPLQFNRLIKIHVLFSSHYMKWNIRQNPLIAVSRNIVLAFLCFVIITSHFVYEMGYYYTELSMDYFFGDKLCTSATTIQTQCEVLHPAIGIVMHWIFEFVFSSHLPKTLVDITIAIGTSFIAYILCVYCKGKFLAYLYLRYRDINDYQYFVFNLNKYYYDYGIHKELIKRLEKYLICHYRYYTGVNDMDRDSFRHEPFDIYWKVQGEVAQKIIGESGAFQHADSAFIREMACASRYIIMPKNAKVFLFGSKCKNVTWIVQGYVKSESYDGNGNIQKKYYEPGDMLSVSAVLFGKYALKTYTCYTDCEMLYISYQEFFHIYKRYPHEWHYLKTTLKQFTSRIEEIYEEEVINHNEYHTKEKPVARVHSSSSILGGYRELDPYTVFTMYNIWNDPESKLMQIWLLFRAIIVIVSITNASLQGSISSLAFDTFQTISAVCDAVAWIDIALKVFIAYYDSHGLLITDKNKCLKNYLTKGFLMDIIGAIPWFELLGNFLSKSIDYDDIMLINTCCKFSHIYIVLAYFNYIGDIPTANANSMIIKWQVVNILIVFAASHFFMSHCVKHRYEEMGMKNVTIRRNCWLPKFFHLSKTVGYEPHDIQLHFLFVQSLHLAQGGMMFMNHGYFSIEQSSHGLWFVLIVLGVIFWCVTCYTLTLLVLASRENTLFQYGVNSLETFLKNERVENQTINSATAHFRYCWMRTKGINIQQMMNKRIGVVLGQDLSYACFKTTYAVLNTLLKGEESMQKQLASFSIVNFFLPGHEIMREMDLVPDIYVVHRGKVVIKKEGKKILTLTKGDVFGQLVGTRLGPVKISAEAYTHTDVLQISIKNFQEIISDEVRQTIAENAQSQSDFLATKTWYIENPYDSIEYILRARKTLQFPWMYEPLKVHHRSWYAWWLYMTWLFGPSVTVCIVVLLPWPALPPPCVRALYIILILLDILHVTNFVAEYYSTNITVEENRCVRRIIGWNILKEWGFYIDVLTLVIPLISFVKYDPRYQFAKIMRLKWLVNFDHHFCQGFKTKAAPRALRTAIVVMLLHIFTCGWIYIACDSKFSKKCFAQPLFSEAIRPMLLKLELEDSDYDVFPELNASMVDGHEWIHPKHRLQGCARINIPLETFGFVVPVYWPHDYIVALSFIVLIYTHTNLSSVVAITLEQVYYKFFVTYAMYVLEMWLISLAIGAIYTRFRDFYQFDYLVMNLTTFLNDSGLCPSILNDLREYTDNLWRKHRGNWLPELAYEAPVCLREDLFVALYMHHLNTPSTFRQLPYYFKRQLAARLERTVILPGKYIVQEGDVLNVTFFIHEGEVEKRHNNSEGEGQFLSLLYTNGYFGCMPGIFANSAFQYSYLTRTVVDLVYLRLENWEDLLVAYPEIKKSFFEATRSLKQETAKVVHGQ